MARSISWRAPMKKRVLVEGWMTRSRKGSFWLPLFRSHWIRRYFVLQLTNSSAELVEYQCDKKDRHKKTYDLSKCEQVDSYLQVADTACAYPRFSLLSQWIFSLHMQNGDEHTKPNEVFFVSKSESEMNSWVSELCRVCNLVRQAETAENGMYDNRNGREEVPSSLISSDHSSESLIDPPSDVTSEGAIGRDRQLMQKHRLIGKFESTPRSIRHNGHTPAVEMRIRTRNVSADHLPRASSSASACSSMASSHRSITTEDDASSLHSTHSMGMIPPLPPKPTIKQRHHSTATSSGMFGSRSRVIDLGQSIPAPSCTLVEVDNESSGETIKMHTISRHDLSHPSSTHYTLPQALHGYHSLPSGSGSKTSSVCSSMMFGPVGPPVDRSKKPAKLRLESDDHFDEDSSMRSGNSGTLTRTPRTPQHSRALPRYRFAEPPKSAGHLTRTTGHLDYFEPKVTLERAISVRSSTPSDFDYIKIDAAKTQAIKRAAAATK